MPAHTTGRSFRERVHICAHQIYRPQVLALKASIDAVIAEHQQNKAELEALRLKQQQTKQRMAQMEKMMANQSSPSDQLEASRDEKERVNAISQAMGLEALASLIGT